MALSAKREGFKHVPWFSLREWLQVYSQIYSNDSVEQDKGYKTLLVWKARMPKLPVGVECTLGLIQVCLRDRELTLRIENSELPVFYENDLCLMYSTTIMRFLNHISNLGHTKQMSLFQIAKQLEIPEWIVNLRHDTAHGHELPSLSSLRLAANILLTWLHDEYWSIEAKNMEEFLMRQMEVTEEKESEEADALTDLIELWIAVGLYIRANYSLVDEIPDNQLQNALQDLRKLTLNLSEGKRHNSPSLSAAFGPAENRDAKSTSSDTGEETGLNHGDAKSDKKFKLSTARGILLTEISRYLGKNKSIAKKEELVLNVLLETEVFLPHEDSLEIFTNGRRTDESCEDDLPSDMIDFWQDFILLLQETKMLQSIVLRLLKLLNDSTEQRYRKSMAALWIKVITRGLLKMKVSQHLLETLQHSMAKKKKRISAKLMSIKIRNKINELHPNLKNGLTLNVLGDVPNCLTSLDFVTDLALNANEYSAKFIPILLDLVAPSIEKNRKQLLLELIEIYIGNDIANGDTNTSDKETIYTIEDLEKVPTEEDHQEVMEVEEISEEAERIPKILDRTIRNTSWELASANYDWGSCPIGILPWQLDTMESLAPLTATTPVKEIKLPTADRESRLVPGMIEMSILKVRSNINWDGVFRNKRRIKRKRPKREADVIVNRAIEIVKKNH